MQLQKEDFYEVDEILDYKCIKHRKYYLIKWKGYSNVDNTWEPLSNLSNVQQMVLEFEKKEKAKRRREKMLRPTCRKGRPKKIKPVDQEELPVQGNGPEKEVEKVIQQVKEINSEDMRGWQQEVSSHQMPSAAEIQEEEVPSEQDQQQQEQQQGDMARRPTNFQRLFEQVANQVPEEVLNNQKMKLLRNQVSVEYLVHYYLSTQSSQAEDLRANSEDSWLPSENYLQRPVMQALLKQIIQFTDYDANEIAMNQAERLLHQ